MDDLLASKLLGSIETDRLVIFCGAGLSMAAPSSVPSANSLASTCAPLYQRTIGLSLPAPAQTNLEELARFSYMRNELVRLLIQNLIPTRSFTRNPNKGHFAIADFLACHAFECGVTTNVDCLVEDAAKTLGEDLFQSALDGDAANISTPHRPYLKIHGCLVKDIANTVWCHEQLNDEPLRTRIQRSIIWLQTALQGRDLIFVGFWSDWSYLNGILASCVRAAVPAMVLLVDLDDPATLQQKAPDLWAWAHGAGVQFRHERTSGADFLDELRKRFSRNFMERLLSESLPTYTQLSGNVTPVTLNLGASSTEDLYELRRDACGVPKERVSRDKRPRIDMQLVGAFHILLQIKGAVLTGSIYVFRGKAIRLINTPGQVLSQVKVRFATESQPHIANYLVVCVGVRNDLNVPMNVVRAPSPQNIVRPSLAGEWMDEYEAKVQLGI